MNTRGRHATRGVRSTGGMRGRGRGREEERDGMVCEDASERKMGGGGECENK